MIPSKFNRNYLKDMIGFFSIATSIKIYRRIQGRDLWYLFCIFNISAVIINGCSIYHAAHDIGHAVQNRPLLAAHRLVPGALQKTVPMIIGRNFDFYVGDTSFGRKIVAFFNPTGHKFMTVTGAVCRSCIWYEWGRSNRNHQRGKIIYPYASATPVSLVAREIQYAKNINEAHRYSKSRKMFVSESFWLHPATTIKRWS